MINYQTPQWIQGGEEDEDLTDPYWYNQFWSKYGFGVFLPYFWYDDHSLGSGHFMPKSWFIV